ncbi:MsnO8 family LLM class oxidoreductase [Bosea sp. 124]|uniref:MsnO8 family LLM class oxidoreductase n=1 Tax=Bosea sp. 124 TaxID=2135642 RepID=UPI000D3B7ECF|nr:MsnO8 family LLM class oxidoreductase [Bosea sp. 124]PTM42381.1 luciferase family oxidoreductase group 1 [Bosea sp. 124]
MKLSILDPLVVPRGSTSGGALRTAITMAQQVERLGFTRYWVVEHHDVAFEANPAPEVFAAALAGATSRIRIGVGGVLLNHYSPYKVAEAMRTLNALFPGRIDVGIGRATAGPLADTALKRLREAELPDDQAERVEELIGWLGNDLPESSPFHGIGIMRDEPPGPLPWILAVSEESARRAATLGLGLACSAFHKPEQAPHSMAAYRAAFRPSVHAAGIAAPQAFIAVRVIIGETQEEAERLAMPVRAVFRLRRSPDRIMVENLPSFDEAVAIMGGMVPAGEEDWPVYLVGTPAEVKTRLQRMAEITGVQEFMIQDFLDDPVLRLRNYERLAREFGLTS